MARVPVVQIQCDRCKRVELIPTSKVKAGGDAVLDLVFQGKELKYDDLCTRCQTAVSNLVSAIRDYEREIKQAFLGGPNLSPDAAPPLQVAPNYTPPQPHAAGAKR